MAGPWRRVEGGLAGLAAAFAEPAIDERRDAEEQRLAAQRAEHDRRQQRAEDRARNRDD